MQRTLLLIALAGCTSVTPLPPTIPAEHRIENDPVPPDPETEALDPKISAADWVEPLDSGSCHDAAGRLLVKPCPVRSGIAMSEAKAARFGLFKIRYRELRETLIADLKVFGAQRELYETRLQLADKTIQDLQPGWIDQHKAELGVIGGFVLGIVTVAVVRSVGN